MNITKTNIDGLLILEPKVFSDNRGFFCETYQKNRYQEAGITNEFIQDNLSKSIKGTLRGLHYQTSPFEQAKLVQVIQGEVFDVAVDIRAGSPTFGQHHSVILSENNKLQYFIPKGFAHGFCVLSETAIFQYKCDHFYSPKHERGVLWSDPKLNIIWPIEFPTLSPKDEIYPFLDCINSSELPSYK